MYIICLYYLDIYLSTTVHTLSLKANSYIIKNKLYFIQHENQIHSLVQSLNTGDLNAMDNNPRP